MKNVYDGSLGFTQDIEKLTKEIEIFLIQRGGSSDLHYELPYDPEIEIVAITGATEEENKIPSFRHPLFFKSSKGSNILALDFRLFLKKKDLENMVNLSDYFSDSYNGKLLLYRGLFQYLFIKDSSIFNNVEGFVNASIATVIASIITQMTLDTNLYDSTFMATLVHYYTLDTRIDNIRDTLDKIPINMQRLFIKEDLLKIIMDETSNIVLPSETIDDLVNIIKTYTNSRRLIGLDSDLLVGSLYRGFYALNAKELAIAIIENKPTWYALLYMINTESINRRSHMFKAIKGNNRLTKQKDTTTILETIINDNLKRY